MSKTRGCFLLVLSAGLVCGLGGWGVMRFQGSSARKALEAEWARADRLGLPKQMGELWPAPKNPALNAAPIYTSLVKSGGFEKAKSEADKIGYPTSRAEIEAMDAALAPVARSLADLERAGNMPECRFQRKPGIDVLFPEYATMKTGVNLLSSRARNEAAKGDPLRAMRTLQSAARVSADTGSEQILIAKLVQIATQAIVIRAAQEVLGDYGHRSDVRAEARKILAALGPEISMKNGMKGEWSFQKTALDELESGKMSLKDLIGMSSGADSGSASSSSSPLGDKAAELMFALSMKSEGGRATQAANAARLFLDYYQGLPSDSLRVIQARQASKAVDEALAKGGTELTLAKVLMPVFSQANDAAAKSAVERRLFTALLNALDTPVPPKRLPLPAAQATDPFSGFSLQYRANRKEIRIWSVGTDGNDDGGPVNEDRTKDITVYWPYPKARTKHP